MIIGGFSSEARGQHPQLLATVQRWFQATAAPSVLTRAMIGLLPGLLIELAPDGERQGLPLFQREDVPELRFADFLEVVIDPAGQAGYFARLLRCHGSSFTASKANNYTRLLKTSIHPYRIAELPASSAGENQDAHKKNP
jgi:hypothetical protein